MSQLRRQEDLLGGLGLAAVCAAVCLLVHVPLLRIFAAVPLCLLLPGYALTSALFANSPLDLSNRLTLTLGLSLVVLVIGALLLNWAPGGLRSGSWVVLLLVVIAAATGVAVRRRTEPFTLPSPRWRPRRSHVVNGGVLLLAAVIGVGAVVASRAPLGAPNTVGYETLTMVPLDRDLGVRLKVTSARQQTTAYRLKVYGVSRQVRQVTLRLEPGGAYSLAVRLPRSAVARSISASVVMLGGHWTPRQVRLQLPAA